MLVAQVHIILRALIGYQLQYTITARYLVQELQRIDLRYGCKVTCYPALCGIPCECLCKIRGVDKTTIRSLRC